MIEGGCEDYQILNDSSRKSDNENSILLRLPFPDFQCDALNSEDIDLGEIHPILQYLKTSSDWKGSNWYRFMGPAGIKMPESVAYCGNHLKERNGRTIFKGLYLYSLIGNLHSSESILLQTFLDGLMVNIQLWKEKLRNLQFVSLLILDLLKLIVLCQEKF